MYFSSPVFHLFFLLIFIKFRFPYHFVPTGPYLEIKKMLSIQSNWRSLGLTVDDDMIPFYSKTVKLKGELIFYLESAL